MAINEGKMACLTEQDLSRFVDGDLANAELAEARAHLAACPNCSEKLAVIEEIEKDVQAALIQLSSNSQLVSKWESCSAISDAALISYLDEELPRAEAKTIDEHLEVCNICIEKLKLFAGIKRCWETASHETLPVDLIAQVQSRWTQDNSKKATAPAQSPFRLAVRIIAQGVEFVKDQLTPADFQIQYSFQPAPVLRSPSRSDETQRRKKLIVSRKFDDKDLEVSVTMSKHGESSVNLTITLSKNQKPYQDVRVSLLRDSSLYYSTKSGPSGQIEITGVAAGNYALKIPEESIEWPIEVKDG